MLHLRQSIELTKSCTKEQQLEHNQSQQENVCRQQQRISFTTTAVFHNNEIQSQQLQSLSTIAINKKKPAITLNNCNHMNSNKSQKQQ